MRHNLRNSCNLLLSTLLLVLLTAPLVAGQEEPAYTFGSTAYIELQCQNCSEYADFTLRYQTTIPSGMNKVPMKKEGKGVFSQQIQINQPQLGLIRMGIGVSVPFYVLPGDSLIVRMDINNFDIVQKMDYQGKAAAICDYYFARQQAYQYPETSAKLYLLKYVSRKDSLLREELAFLDSYAASHPELPDWFVRTERSEKPYFRIWDTETIPLDQPEALFSKQYFNYLGIAFKQQIAPEIIQLADKETRAKAILKTFLQKADLRLKGEVRDVFKTLTLTTWLPEVHNLQFADSILQAHRYSFSNPKYAQYLSEFRNDVILQALSLPEFSYVHYEGKKFSLQELRGKAVYINFWFVGCRPCLNMLPYEKRLAEELNPEEVVLVNICFYGSEEKWRSEVEEKDMPGINLFAPASIEKQVIRDFNVTGFPHYVLADRNGIIYMESAPGPAVVMPKIRELLSLSGLSGLQAQHKDNNQK